MKSLFIFATLFFVVLLGLQTKVQAGPPPPLPPPIGPLVPPPPIKPLSVENNRHQFATMGLPPPPIGLGPGPLGPSPLGPGPLGPGGLLGPGPGPLKPFAAHSNNQQFITFSSTLTPHHNFATFDAAARENFARRIANVLPPSETDTTTPTEVAAIHNTPAIIEHIEIVKESVVPIHHRDENNNHPTTNPTAIRLSPGESLIRRSIDLHLIDGTGSNASMTPTPAPAPSAATTQPLVGNGFNTFSFQPFHHHHQQQQQQQQQFMNTFQHHNNNQQQQFRPFSFHPQQQQQHHHHHFATMQLPPPIGPIGGPIGGPLGGFGGAGGGIFGGILGGSAGSGSIYDQGLILGMVETAVPIFDAGAGLLGAGSKSGALQSQQVVVGQSQQQQQSQVQLPVGGF